MLPSNTRTTGTTASVASTAITSITAATDIAQHMVLADLSGVGSWAMASTTPVSTGDATHLPSNTSSSIDLDTSSTIVMSDEEEEYFPSAHITIALARTEQVLSGDVRETAGSKHNNNDDNDRKIEVSYQISANDFHDWVAAACGYCRRACSQIGNIGNGLHPGRLSNIERDNSRAFPYRAKLDICSSTAQAENKAMVDTDNVTQNDVGAGAAAA